MFGMAVIKVVRAEISREKNLITEMDPYCIIKTNSGEVKTSVAKGMGKNPAWNDSFNLNFNGDNTVYIGVWDKETLTPDDIIGETTINLMGNLNNGPYASWHPLFYKGASAGQIYVEILFNGGGDRGNLTATPGVMPTPIMATNPVLASNTVTGHGNQAISGFATLRVVRAELIRDKSILTNMDPYVVIRTNAAEVQTNVATGQGKTPTWNNAFSINMTGDQILHVSVFDKSLLKDGLIGETTVNLGTTLNAGLFAGWVPLYYKGQTAGQLYLEIDATNTNAQTVGAQGGLLSKILG
jgi:Ca2+-dependent lipid-binding protein